MDELKRLVARTDGLREILHRVLDRRERSGSVPRSLTIDAGPELERALRALLGADAVRRRASGRVQLRFGKASRTGEPLMDTFYTALGRTPASQDADARGRARALEEALHRIEGRSAVARAYLERERAVLRGQARTASDDAPSLFAVAERDGLEAARREAERVVRVIDTALTNRQLLRLPAFAAVALGHSKALRWGGETYRRAGAALADHEPDLRAQIASDLVPRRHVPAFAFEAFGIYRDSAAASVLVFGPLRYRKRSLAFDGPLQHARLGEPVRLTTAQLRDAEIEPVERVWLVENLTPFLDLVDVATRPTLEEVMSGLLVCTGGQASWAVVSLLRGLARHGVPMHHAGDLDRSGVHILRSLRRRTGAKIAPWFMDAETHARFADRGLPLSDTERGRVGRTLQQADPAELGHDVLQAVAGSGVWIEQEAFSDETLVPSLQRWLDGDEP